MTVTMEQIQNYFEAENTGQMKDLTKLQSGQYSNFYTMVEFLQFKAGFQCAVNHFGGG